MPLRETPGSGRRQKQCSGALTVLSIGGVEIYLFCRLSSKQNSSANQDVFQGQQANSLQQILLTRFLIRNVKLEMFHLYDNIRGKLL